MTEAEIYCKFIALPYGNKIHLLLSPSDKNLTNLSLSNLHKYPT